MLNAQVPPPSGVAVPTVTPLTSTWTWVAPLEVPVKVWVAELVMLSLLLAPRSVPAVRSGVDGVEGPATVKLMLSRPTRQLLPLVVSA